MYSLFLLLWRSFSDIYFAISAMNTIAHTRIAEHIGPYSLEAWTGGVVSFDTSPTNHPHLHETYHELCLVLDGHGVFRHDTREFALAPGSVFISELNTEHEISSFRSRDLRLVFCSLSLQRTPTESLHSTAESAILEHFGAGHALHTRDANSLRDYVPLMAAAGPAATDMIRRHAALRLFVLEGLALLTVTAPERSTDTPPDAVRRALDHIERHVHAPLNVAQLARACFCSERHLRRLFLEQTGRGVLDTINERRMHLAAQQLLMRFSVAEVSLRFGMSSVAHFSRLFKRVHGLSPKQYQQRHAPAPAPPRTRFRPGRGATPLGQEGL